MIEERQIEADIVGALTKLGFETPQDGDLQIVYMRKIRDALVTLANRYPKWETP